MDLTNRAGIRREIRKRRQTLDAGKQRLFSCQMAGRVRRDSLFRNSRSIGAYLPADGEISPLPLLESAWLTGKKVYLPVLVPFSANRLWFAAFDPGDRLVSNRFGILEPARVHWRRIPAYALDLVLAPLVAFDAQGNRLGMGGGFYDQSFAFLHRRHNWIKPRLLGLAYELQHMDRIPSQKWDVPLHAIATEQKIYHCSCS